VTAVYTTPALPTTIPVATGTMLGKFNFFAFFKIQNFVINVSFRKNMIQLFNS
jgi:hypothetical protein